MTELSKSQVAVSFHYLAESLLTYFNKLDNGDASISELFGEGEDGWLDELYPYAEAIEEAWGTRCKDRDAPGVWAYEIADDLAPKLFIEMIQCNTGDMDPRPDLDSWRRNVAKLVNLWVDCKTKHDQPILPQLNDRVRKLSDIAIRQKNAVIEDLLKPFKESGVVTGVMLKETRAQNLTEIFIGERLYAAIDFKIIGHEAITTVDFRGLPNE